MFDGCLTKIPFVSFIDTSSDENKSFILHVYDMGENQKNFQNVIDELIKNEIIVDVVANRDEKEYIVNKDFNGDAYQFYVKFQECVFSNLTGTIDMRYIKTI